MSQDVHKIVTSDDMFAALSQVYAVTRSYRHVLLLYLLTLHFVLTSKNTDDSVIDAFNAHSQLALGIIFQRHSITEQERILEKMWDFVENKDAENQTNEHFQISFYTFLKGLEQEYVYGHEYYGYDTLVHIAVALKYLSLAYIMSTTEDKTRH